jgi:hypothetical protein
MSWKTNLSILKKIKARKNTMDGAITIKDLRKLLLEVEDQTMTVEIFRLLLENENQEFELNNNTKGILNNYKFK